MRRLRARALALLRRRRVRGALLLALALPVVVVLAVAGHRSALVDPEPTLLLHDRHGHFLAELAASDDADAARGYWPVAELPPRVVAATLAIEDRRFRSHPGVDPRALARALWQNLSSQRRVSGASTIAMQVARLQSPGRRTYRRKLVEATTALLLVGRHGRDAVLAQYLRLAPYGNRIRGIRYAARRYFHKPVDDLSWAETAFLVALPQAPGRMNPYTAAGRERAKARGQRILALLLASGELDPRQHRTASEQLARLRPPPRARRPVDAMHAILEYEERLRDGAARAAVDTARPVRASLDLPLQRWIGDLTFRALERWEDDGAGNAAVVVIDRHTLAVRASLGSSGYFDDAHAGALDYSRLPRSAGSTLKPFLYALALERGTITPATILDDLGRGPGGIENSDRDFLGPLLPRTALANSRNVPAALLLEQTGLEAGHERLARLELHDRALPASRYGLGLAVGNLAVTLRDLVAAYAALGNDGRRGELRWLEAAPPSAREPVLDPDAARLVTRWLADPMARLPTFPRMGHTELPFPAAIKTGTTSGYRDAWAVAITRDHVAGVWIGHPANRTMKGLSGYLAASALLREVLLHLGDGDGDGDGIAFPPPRGHQEVTLCARTGHLATAACDRTSDELLRPEVIPTESCRAHVRIDFRTFTDLGPRYAAWAAANDLPPPPSDDAPPLAALRPRLTTLAVTAPENGLRLLSDPETPPEHATVALAAVIDPPVAQAVWYVDGEPYRVVDHPYTTRWPLRPGEHTFEVRLPYADARSRAVRVRVD